MAFLSSNGHAKVDKTTAAFPYEFGGPMGALATTLILPVVVLWLVHCSDVGHVDLPLQRLFSETAIEGHPPLTRVLSSFDHLLKSGWEYCCDNREILAPCTATLLAWFLFQVVLERCLPGELVQGVPIATNDNKSGSDPTTIRLSYRLNGHLAFWVTLLLLNAGWPVWHEASGTVQLTRFPYLPLAYDYATELALCAIGLCFILTTYLYLISFHGNKILAKPGTSGNHAYDYFMGRELNPRIGTFDWKCFCELRPGLIGWMLLNLSCLQQQYDRLGYVTGSMILLNIFQGLYVWDALFQERAILTTMDITTDGFGYMLVFGDLCWVPFTYSLQAQYLVKHDPHLSWTALAAIVVLHLLGFALFRGANGQKDAFRRNPNDPALSHLKFLQTKRGTKLLISGWWGYARKINYTGDWIMGLSWCLVCGFDSIVPYYYAIYFAILLTHRSIRDDHACAAKYGDDWITYKELVQYRFVPGIF